MLYTIDDGHLTDSGAMGSGMMINVYSIRNAGKHSIIFCLGVSIAERSGSKPSDDVAGSILR
jgi:hypothetical protein